MARKARFDREIVLPKKRKARFDNEIVLPTMGSRGGMSVNKPAPMPPPEAMMMDETPKTRNKKSDALLREEGKLPRKPKSPKPEGGKKKKSDALLREEGKLPRKNFASKADLMGRNLDGKPPAKKARYLGKGQSPKSPAHKGKKARFDDEIALPPKKKARFRKKGR